MLIPVQRKVHKNVVSTLAWDWGSWQKKQRKDQVILVKTKKLLKWEPFYHTLDKRYLKYLTFSSSVDGYKCWNAISCWQAIYLYDKNNPLNSSIIYRTNTEQECITAICLFSSHLAPFITKSYCFCFSNHVNGTDSFNLCHCLIVIFDLFMH